MQVYIQLNLPRSTVHDILSKRLKLNVYRIQLVQTIRDRNSREQFASEMLSLNQEDET
jgi:hypothetical protein